MKICKKCLKLKNESEFTLDKSKKDNLTIYCKDCQKLKREKYKGTFDHNQYYNQNYKEKRKDYYQNNKEKKKQYYIDNIEKKKEYRKKYWQKNKEILKEKYKGKYKYNNKPIK
jgi:hypothetical protein